MTHLFDGIRKTIAKEVREELKYKVWSKWLKLKDKLNMAMVKADIPKDVVEAVMNVLNSEIEDFINKEL